MAKLNKFALILILSIYIILNLNMPTGMPRGLTVNDIKIASQKISEDAKGDFNVAEVLDFDKRAYVLRYFLEYKYGKKPLDVVEYQNIKLLYVLAQKGYNFNDSDVWEVKAGGKYSINELSDVGDGYVIYKLTK